jgi:hypothetical protein
MLLSSVVVNTTLDDSVSALPAGLITLRDAVGLANQSPTPCTIVFDPKVFDVPRKITLTDTSLELSNTRQPIAISDPSAALTITNPNYYSEGALVIDRGVNAMISNVNIANCFETAIINHGTLAFLNGSVSNCVPTNGGAGALDNYGTANLANDTFAQNSGDAGGAIDNVGSLTITGTTISGNQTSDSGGAIDNEATLSLINDTLSNNQAGSGGALYNSGSASLVNVTISNNVASAEGGGIVNDRYTSKTATVTMANSIVAGNVLDYFDAREPDIGGIITTSVDVHSLGHNLIGQADGVVGLVSSDISGTAAHPLDPRLAPLANYGGTTKTMPPTGGSPALGAGSIALLPAGTTTDQREKPRVSGGKVDIGAVQMSGPVSLTLTAPPAQAALRFKPTAINLGSIESPSGKLPITVVVNWGDGSPDSSLRVTKLGTLSRLAHSFLVPGVLSVSLGATDSSALSNLITFTINVTDAPAVVTSLKFNASSGSGLLGLGDAVALVDATKADAAMNFDPALFATPRTIGIGDVLLSGHHTITIDGPAADVTLEGKTFIAGIAGIGIAPGTIADVSRIAVTGCYDSGITNYGELHLSDSTISGNIASTQGGGIDNSGTMFLTGVTISGNSAIWEGGAGIFNESYATATLQNVNIIDNHVVNTGAGGGIANEGSMTIVRGNISRNSGGGIDNSSQLDLTNVNITNNTSTNVRYLAIGVGGGISNEGTANLTNVNISHNSALDGGGAFNAYFATMNLTNVTIADNTASDATQYEGQVGFGGGLFNSGIMTFNSVTVAGNEAYLAGGGILNNIFGDRSPVPFNMSNSIVADNSVMSADGSGPDISGTIHSLGHNLIGKADGSFGWTQSDLQGTTAHPLDPKLAPLGYYGQFTAAMPPLPGSPAVDRGSNELIPKSVTTDQRGLPRISHGMVDIGAVELQQPQIAGLFLVDARTGQTIMPLTDGATVNLSNIPKDLDVVAVLRDGVPGSVVFGLDGNSRFRIEKQAPFSLFGDVGGRYLSGAFAAGKHTITVQVYADTASTEPVGKLLTVHFAVVGSRL